MDTVTTGETRVIFESLIAMLGAWVMVLGIISVVVAILKLVANWRIFSKAGVGGWKSLIPIYNSYTSYKICWAGIAFWISVVLGLLASLFAGLAYPYDLLYEVKDQTALLAFLQNPANEVFLIIAGVFMALSFIWTIVKQWKMSKVFGHGFGYFLGLLFFPTLFTLILGFGSSEYVGLDE